MEREVVILLRQEYYRIILRRKNVMLMEVICRLNMVSVLLIRVRQECIQAKVATAAAELQAVVAAEVQAETRVEVQAAALIVAVQAGHQLRVIDKKMAA